MKEKYVISRIEDGLNDYCVDTLEEAVAICKEKEFDNEIYRIGKILEEDGSEMEWLKTYDVSGNELD